MEKCQRLTAACFILFIPKFNITLDQPWKYIRVFLYVLIWTSFSRLNRITIRPQDGDTASHVDACWAILPQVT